MTAAAETAIGLALLGLPSLVVSLLFGGSLDTTRHWWWLA
jgi:hypothetical protein